MTSAEYDERYREALLLLQQAGVKVGTPESKSGMMRLCPLDGEPTNDLGVFRRAFGDEVALEILGEAIASMMA